MLDKGEVDQDRSMAEDKTPLRQHGGQLGNSDGGFEWSAGELKPCPALPRFHIDDAGGSQPALALFRGQQNFFFSQKVL